MSLNRQLLINNIQSCKNLSIVSDPTAAATTKQQQLNFFIQHLQNPQLHLFQQQQQQLRTPQQLQQLFQQHQQQLQNPQQYHQILQQYTEIYHNQTNANNNIIINSNNANNNNNNNSNIINNANNHAHISPATNGTKKLNQRNAPKKELIELVTCNLCKGYLIDAVTLDMCMHSFCKACAIKYIREKPRCPECNIEITEKRSLRRLKTDHTIQNIVYKLVPGLYEREMSRRRKFYAARPTQTPRHANEMFGDIPPCKSIKPDQMINIGITWNKDCLGEPIKTYLYCRADCTMLILRKLLVGKFGLDRPIKIYYGNSEIFFDLTTIMDVAATYNWKPEDKVLNFTFREVEEETQSPSSSLRTNPGPVPSNGPSKSPC